VPGTGFEPVCLSAARFKFAHPLFARVRQGSRRAHPLVVVPRWTLADLGELQLRLQLRTGICSQAVRWSSDTNCPAASWLRGHSAVSLAAFGASAAAPRSPVRSVSRRAG
jgi:hypothetical protein